MPAIRISLQFRRLPNPELRSFAQRVHDAMSGNSAFPAPTVALPDLETAYLALEQAIIAAKDGGVLLVAAQASRRVVVIDLLRELAAYVQLMAKGDPVAALSSGFFLASRNTAQLPLATPHIRGLSNPASTKIGLKLTPVKNARVYEVWLRVGEGEWKLWQSFPNTRQMVLTGLTPGTLYGIRARAVGGSTGYSDWCDATSLMST